MPSVVSILAFWKHDVVTLSPGVTYLAEFDTQQFGSPFNWPGSFSFPRTEFTGSPYSTVGQFFMAFQTTFVSGTSFTITWRDVTASTIVNSSVATVSHGQAGPGTDSFFTLFNAHVIVGHDYSVEVRNDGASAVDLVPNPTAELETMAGSIVLYTANNGGQPLAIW